jgi:glycosyltransferase involved in cell wall biosynthesis
MMMLAEVGHYSYMAQEVSILDRTAAALPRLRICVVTETYPPEVNGVALTLERCVNAMRDRGHQVVVVRPGQNGVQSSQDELITAGIPIPGYPGLKMGMPAKTRLRQHWQSWRPDLVHVITEGPLGWSALSLAESMHIPVVADFHTNFHSYGRHYGWGWFSQIIYGYLKHFHNRAQLTLVPTRGMRERLIADGFKRLEVVARGVDINLFNPKRRENELRLKWGLGPDDLAILYVGRLAPEKNLPVVLQAFDAIQKVEPRAKLVLVGDGPARATLETEQPNYIFAGIRRGEDLAAHYASADIFLFPSLTETFGNVTLEAMASGLAVVAYDYAAAAEHITDRESGLLVPYDDTSAFIQTAKSVVQSSSLRNRIRSGAVLSCEPLGWEQVMDDMERALVKTVHAETQAILPAVATPRSR